MAPSKVVKVTNNTAGDVFFGKKFKTERVFADDGHLVSGSTIAIVANGKSFISGLFDDHMVICEEEL